MLQIFRDVGKVHIDSVRGFTGQGESDISVRVEDGRAVAVGLDVLKVQGRSLHDDDCQKNAESCQPEHEEGGKAKEHMPQGVFLLYSSPSFPMAHSP